MSEETQNQEQQPQEEQQPQDTQQQAQTPTEEVPAAEPQAEAAPEPNPEEELNKKLAEANDKYLRLAAEYDNYRRRTAKEKADLLKSASSDVLKALLPILDDFERALTHMTDEADVKAVREGVDLIHKKFVDFLAKNNVKEIPAKDLDFNPDVHEAVTTIAAPTPELVNKVFDCVEKGYMLDDKVIRYAKVVVCQ